MKNRSKILLAVLGVLIIGAAAFAGMRGDLFKGALKWQFKQPVVNIQPKSLSIPQPIKGLKTNIQPRELIKPSCDFALISKDIVCASSRSQGADGDYGGCKGNSITHETSGALITVLEYDQNTAKVRLSNVENPRDVYLTTTSGACPVVEFTSKTGVKSSINNYHVAPYPYHWDMTVGPSLLKQNRPL